MKRLDHYWYDFNIVAFLMLPLAVVFCLISLLRRLMYKIYIFRSYKLPVPVIIIGNITVGGTGKTPMLVEVCKQLKLAGLKPGIISRGYGGKSKQWPLDVKQDSDALETGDEPLMLARRTQCPVVVGPDRVADAKHLLEHYDCNVILSDDGMQHYRLRRDFEIAIVDAKRKSGNGFCLPAGPLREPKWRLNSADLVIENGGDMNEFAYRVIAEKVISITSSKQAELKEFKDHLVHALAGIGNPDRFFNILETNQINYIPHIFPDHHVYRIKDLQFSDELAVIMTEKDAVKCKKYSMNHYWYMPIDVDLSDKAQSKLDEIIQKVSHG